MFGNLSKFDYQRTKKEAFIFYLVYLAVSVLASITVWLMYGSLWGEGSQYSGALTSGALSFSLSFSIIRKKKLKLSYIFIALAAGALGFVGGAFLSLIIPTYLTTLEKNK